MAEYPINPKHNVFKKYRTVNYINSYVFAPPVDLTTNTEIGGVASTISTPALLATRLSIDVSRITNFSIVGSDIQCGISGSYVIPTWPGTDSLVYFRDNDGLVTSFGRFNSSAENLYLYFPGIINQNGSSVLQDRALGFTIEMPNCLSLPNSFFGNLVSSTKTKTLIVPRCTSFGATKLNNGVFNANMNGIIYAPVSEQTSNAGAPDGDLTYAISQGATVRYVTNFTAPNPITNLSVGNVYGTAMQLIDNGTNVNAIDYYENVKVNGVSYPNIPKNGYITGLTPSTSYTIEAVAVDIFYNKSTSNVVSVTTTINTSNTDVDVNAYVSAANLSGVELDSAYQLITDLKTAGLWTKIQALYPFKGTTAAQHKWNAKNPLDTNAAFRLVFSGTGTYSNLGFQCNGTNSFANTFLNNNIQNANNQGLTVVVGTNNTKNDAMEMGLYNVSGYSYINVKRYTSNGERAFSANGIGTGQFGVFEAKGIFTGTKLIQSTAKLFRNSTLISSATNGTSLGLVNLNHYIGCINTGSAYAHSPQRIQIAIIHEGLSDAEVATLHAIIDTSETIAGRKTW